MFSQVSCSYYYADCHYTECHYAQCPCTECPCTECPYAECPYAECHYAQCHFMLSVIMLSVIMLSVIMLSVILLSVIWSVSFCLVSLCIMHLHVGIAYIIYLIPDCAYLICFKVWYLFSSGKGKRSLTSGLYSKCSTIAIYKLQPLFVIYIQNASGLYYKTTVLATLP